jgi:glycosyltransferase involved in cell wall biosynthesis
VLEACAAGVPVVASDLPGIREVAGRLSGVHCLSQAMSDERWADAVRQALACPPSRTSRQMSLCDFEQSVFYVGLTLQMVQQVWAGVPPRQIRSLSSIAA